MAAYSENIDTFSYLAICEDIPEDEHPVDPATGELEEIAYEVRLDMSESTQEGIAIPSTMKPILVKHVEIGSSQFLFHTKIIGKENLERFSPNIEIKQVKAATVKSYERIPGSTRH